MNPSKSLLLAIGICSMALSGITWAGETLSMRQFAYGSYVQVSRAAAIYQAALPEIIYQHVYREDLGDLRVFNGQAEVVPHVVLRGQQQEAKLKRTEEIKFYPLFREKESNFKKIFAQTQIDNVGAILELREESRSTSNEIITGYILDLSQIKDYVTEFNLTWGDSKKNFIKTIPVYASENLKDWELVNDTTVLVDLTRKMERVRKSKIAISGQYKYFYLDWPLGKEKVELNSVAATIYQTIEKTEIRWKALEQAYQSGRTIDFTCAGFFPVDRLRIKLPQENTVVSAMIQSRKNAKAEWEVRYSGILYRIKNGRTELSNDVIELSRNEDRLWRIEIQDEVETIGAGTFVLELGYIQDEVLFMARGQEPYTLVYGNSRVQPSENTIESFLSDLGKERKEKLIQTASLQAEKELAGPKVLKTPFLPVNWREWLIWIIYGGILIVLGLMINTLIREMSKEKSKLSKSK